MAATSSHDDTVRLWETTDPARPRALARLRGHIGNVKPVAFSPDGTTLASDSDDRTVRIWDVPHPRHAAPIAVLRGHRHFVDALAYSPDGLPRHHQPRPVGPSLPPSRLRPAVPASRGGRPGLKPAQAQRARRARGTKDHGGTSKGARSSWSVTRRRVEIRAHHSALSGCTGPRPAAGGKS
jgi:hypothetical protein